MSDPSVLNPVFGPPSPFNGDLAEIAHLRQYAAFWMPEPTTGITGPTFMHGNPWDIVYINHAPVPGICSVKCQPAIQIDVKHAPGRDGAVITPKGYLPGPIEISTVLWTPDQWNEFQDIVSLVWPRAKKQATFRDALTVEHPVFHAYKINAVVVTGLSAPEPGPFTQSKIVRIRCVEFQDPGAEVPTTTKRKPKDPPEDKRLPSLNSPPAPSKGGNGLSGPPKNTIGGAT